MCGRYNLTTPPAQLMDRFALTRSDMPIEPRLNICPTEDVPVILNILPQTLSVARWGLIPFWAKDPRIGAKMINARAEEVAEKPAFRNAFQKRRCLIVADGFYEWRKNEDGSKTPLRYTLADGKPFAFAGLWEFWRPPAMEPVRSCTIITTEANKLVSPVHDRMPVILPRELEKVWLSKDEESYDRALAALKPFPADKMIVVDADPADLVIQRKVKPASLPALKFDS